MEQQGDRFWPNVAVKNRNFGLQVHNRYRPRVVANRMFGRTSRPGRLTLHVDSFGELDAAARFQYRTCLSSCYRVGYVVRFD